MQTQIDQLTLSLSKMMGERNLFRAEAHAKEKEHELVSKRFLEIRLENDIVKLENIRLRDALKNIGAEVDDMMTQQKQAMKVKIKKQQDIESARGSS